MKYNYPLNEIMIKGGVMEPHKLSVFPLLMNRISVCGSLIGGIANT